MEARSRENAAGFLGHKKKKKGKSCNFDKAGPNPK